MLIIIFCAFSDTFEIFNEYVKFPFFMIQLLESHRGNVSDIVTTVETQTTTIKVQSNTVKTVTVRKRTLPMNAMLAANTCIKQSCQSHWCFNNGSLLCKPGLDGWLIWLKRDPHHLISFTRNWTQYVSGFGNPTKNYWLGLEKLHLLTGTGTKFKLRVELESWYTDGLEWAEYGQFSVGNSTTMYALKLKDFRGSLTFDALQADLMPENGVPFTTYDRDNDGVPNINCAYMSEVLVCYRREPSGGWWHQPRDKSVATPRFGGCSLINPTAALNKQRLDKECVSSAMWYLSFKHSYESLKSIAMKLQPVN